MEIAIAIAIASKSSPPAAQGRAAATRVFTDLRGGMLCVSNYRTRVCAPAVAECRKADGTFPVLTPHDLRHTAASLAVSAGANVKAVQRDARTRQGVHDAGRLRRPVR
jgi:integrase